MPIRIHSQHEKEFLTERKGFSLKSMRAPHWIIVGPNESWEAAFRQNGIWGVKKHRYAQWKALDPGDIIFFYGTQPITGVIGVGQVETKFIQDKPLWPDEMAAQKVIYPLRFEFHVNYLLEQKEWRSKRITVELSPQEGRSGIGFLREETIELLYRAFKEQFGYTISPPRSLVPPPPPTVPEEILPPSHTEVQDLLMEIGKLNRFIAEKEYLMENERLDVVWRRVEGSVPTYVFEVQVAGDIYHALGKLKHAFDIWNSNIFLVADEKALKGAERLLRGTFHEIQDKLKKLTVQKVRELYQAKCNWVNLEEEIGIR